MLQIFQTVYHRNLLVMQRGGLMKGRLLYLFCYTYHLAVSDTGSKTERQLGIILL